MLSPETEKPSEFSDGFFVGSDGFLWVLVGSDGFLWVLMGSCGFLWVLVFFGGLFKLSSLGYHFVNLDVVRVGR